MTNGISTVHAAYSPPCILAQQERTPAQQAEGIAKQDYEDSLVNNATNATQVNHTTLPVILASVTSSHGILPQLPIELLAIIAGYEHEIIEADSRIILYILNGLDKALTNTPELAIRLNKPKTMRESQLNHHQLATHLIQLQTLNFKNSQLITLPDSIGRLIHLTWFNLEYNNLLALPDAIGNLNQLRYLNLFGNQLTILPSTIGSLLQLRSLDLCYNQLKILPEAIGNLIQLELLFLQHNHLKTLPDTIGRLSKLQELDLDNNPFTTLPKSLATLVCLQSKIKKVTGKLYYQGIPIDEPIDESIETAKKVSTCCIIC